MSSYGDWRLSIWDRYGVYLTEIDAPFGCVWALDEIGSAHFEISRHDEKCRKRYLQFGNHLLFEHARLGDWGGIILPHDGRDWNGDGVLTVRARAAEFNFSRRRAPVHDGLAINWVGTPGELFERIIQHMNLKQDCRVRPGNIRKSGLPMQIQLRMGRWDTRIEKLIKHARRQDGGEYYLEPDYDEKGRLVFMAHFVQSRGAEEGYHLHEDVNIETPSGTFLREDGELVNDMGVLSSEADGTNYKWGVSEDAASQDEFGLFEGADTLTTEQESAAETYAGQQVATMAWPRRAFLLNAIETLESPDTFSKLRLGNTIGVHLHSAGFWNDEIGADATVRIVSMEYDTEENKVMLTVEEVETQ